MMLRTLTDLNFDVDSILKAANNDSNKVLQVG